MSKLKIKGTDIYLACICALIIWFVWFSAKVYEATGAWFPLEITLGVWILGLYEMFSLLRVRLIKEGEQDEHGIIAGTYTKVKNWINSKSPIELPDTEIDIEIAKEQANAQADKS